ncbi:ankyrin repeat domain-containing protein [bacterium]|nr:MAG: ankyrin repeat domain-containing protein [bacterium]
MRSIHKAAQHGNAEDLQRLIKNGANVNTKCDDDATPLHYAAFNGHVECVKILLGEKDIFVNVHTKLCGSTPLHFAARNNHFEIVQLLLKKGASFNATDRDGFTPEERAEFNDFFDMARYLGNVRHAQFINIQDEVTGKNDTQNDSDTDEINRSFDQDYHKTITNLETEKQDLMKE